MVLFIVLRNEFLTCETVARMKSLSLTNCLKGAEQNFPVPLLSYTVQDGSNFKVRL